MTDAGTRKHSRVCFFEALFFILNLYLVCEVVSLLLFPAGMFGTSGIARVNFGELIMSQHHFFYYIQLLLLLTLSSVALSEKQKV